MEKLRNIFGKNEITDKAERGTYEETLSMALKTLNKIG